MGFWNRRTDLNERIAPDLLAPGRRDAGPPDVQLVGAADPVERYLRDEDNPRGGAYQAPRHVGGGAGGEMIVNGRKIRDVISLNLANARTDEVFDLAGNFVLFNDSTNGTDRIKVRFATSESDKTAPQVTLRPGEYIAGERFRVLLVTNAAIAGASAELLIGEDLPTDPLIVR